MFHEMFYYSSLDEQEVHQLLLNNGFAIELLIEDYKKATTGERDLLIIAKKIK